MLVCFLRVWILYPLVIFAVRLMGKRQIGELQPTELVVTILISNLATLPLENQDLPLLTGIVPVLTVVCFEVMLSWGSLRWKGLRRLLSGSPQIIIRDGKLDQQAMRRLRFSLDDLMAALRAKDVFDLTQVQFAIVETDGSVSVYPKADCQPVVCSDLGLVGASSNPPEVLIADGSISREGMASAGLCSEQLDAMLAKEQLSASEIFLLTVDAQGLHCCIRKEQSP